MDTNKEKLKKQNDTETKGTVFINDSNVLLRNERREGFVYVIGTIGLLASLVFYDTKILISFVICWVIFYLILMQCNFTPAHQKIKYTCPFCKKKLASGIYNTQKEEQSRMGYMTSYCPKCKKQLKLKVTEKVLRYF